MLNLSTTTTQQVRLTPSIRTKLLKEFRTYAELKAQKDAIEAAMDKHKANIAAIREDSGEVSLEVDGFKTTLVAGTRKEFDEKKYIAEGGDIDIYRASIVERPTKAYEKISTPKS